MSIFSRNRNLKIIFATVLIFAVAVYFFDRANQAKANSIVIVSSGTVTDATGRPTQQHLIYAVNSATWWLFYIASGSTTTLQTKFSSDLTTWNTGASFTLAHANGGEGLNFATSYANISSTDVVHIAFSYNLGGSLTSNHIRATISGNTITYSTETVVGTASANESIDGPAIGFDSNNKIFHMSGFDLNGKDGDENIAYSTNADTGTAWTSGFGTVTNIFVAANVTESRYVANIGSSKAVDIFDNGSGTNVFSDLEYNVITNGTAGTTTAMGLSVTSVNANDWGATTAGSNIYVAVRSGSNTYKFDKFSGSTFSAATAPPNQTSKSTAGIFLASDGTNVWMFVIDNDTPNTVRWNKFNGTSWGIWRPLEATTKTRTFLSGYPKVVNGQIALMWEQVNGANRDITVANLVVDPNVNIRGGVNVRGGVKFR